MSIDKEINNMKCYLFRLAEEKWNLTNKDCSRVFADEEILKIIENNYDYLHLMSYEAALCEIENILKKRGVIYDKT